MMTILSDVTPSVFARAGSFLSETAKRPTAWLLGGRAVQLGNSVLLSAVVVRHFGLKMMGTYALGYIAVAFTPHLLSLGLNSELPRTKRPLPELSFISLAIQFSTFSVLAPLLYLYSRLLGRSAVEQTIIFLVAISGCLTGFSNVGLTLQILLRRFRMASIAPLFEFGLILIGAAMAHSGAGLALYFLAGRTITAMLMWPRLKPKRVAFQDVFPVARQGSKYLILDLLVTFSEQLTPIILGVVTPRAALGTFRLCQQTSSAAETPGWSYVQGRYPELAKGDPTESEYITRQATKIGIGATLLCAVGSFPLAFVVFHTPSVASMILVLSAALVFRYLMYVCDQRLRAEGRVQASAILVIARILLFSIVILLTVKHLGVWAGIWTNAIGAALFGYIYRRVTQPTAAKIAVTQGSPANIRSNDGFTS